MLVVNTATHAIMAAVGSVGPTPDVDQLDGVLTEVPASFDVRRMLLDAGFDSAHNHRLLREEHGILSVIPPTAGRPPKDLATLPSDKYRRQMKTHFNAAAYRRRGQVGDGVLDAEAEPGLGPPRSDPLEPDARHVPQGRHAQHHASTTARVQHSGARRPCVQGAWTPMRSRRWGRRWTPTCPGSTTASGGSSRGATCGRTSSGQLSRPAAEERGTHRVGGRRAAADAAAVPVRRQVAATGAMRDRLQQVVARDHADPLGGGADRRDVAPEEGGATRSGVKRPFDFAQGGAGRAARSDNCVVTVHLGYAAPGGFHCVAGWRAVPAGGRGRPTGTAVPRRRGSPTAWSTGPSGRIALEMLDRARATGVVLPWLTFDEGYGRATEFLHALDDRGQPYVAEVPARRSPGWCVRPRLPHREHHPARPAGPAAVVPAAGRRRPARRRRSATCCGALAGADRATVGAVPREGHHQRARPCGRRRWCRCSSNATTCRPRGLTGCSSPGTCWSRTR